MFSLCRYLLWENDDQRHFQLPKEREHRVPVINSEAHLTIQHTRVQDIAPLACPLVINSRRQERLLQLNDLLWAGKALCRIRYSIILFAALANSSGSDSLHHPSCQLVSCHDESTNFISTPRNTDDFCALGVVKKTGGYVGSIALPRQ